MKVLVLGGDGFCGWPCAVNLADAGHDVVIVDNLSRRKIDIDLGVESLTPLATIGDRLKAWSTTGCSSCCAASVPMPSCISPNSAQLPIR